MDADGRSEMALRSDFSAQVCPIARGVDVLGDPWALLILREVFAGNRRFDGLRTDLGIADAVLSRRLTGLVEAGLLDKIAYAGEVRPRWEYRLTAAGEATLPVLHAIARWGDAHTTAPDPGRIMTVRCADCGRAAESADWCVGCGRPLTRGNTVWFRARDRRPRSGWPRCRTQTRLRRAVQD